MAISLGVNGIFIEVHDRPDESFCDVNTIPIRTISELMRFLNYKINFFQNKYILNEFL